MNSNLVHNVLNILIAVMSLVTAILLATGCTALPNGTLECSASSISPTVTTGIVAVMGVAKTLINIVRDGPAGLVKRQPPVR